MGIVGMFMGFGVRAEQKGYEIGRGKPLQELFETRNRDVSERYQTNGHSAVLISFFKHFRQSNQKVEF